MTDRYQEIRDALAMEPTPGPRRVIDGNSYPYVTVALPENEGRRWDDPIICTLYEDVTPDDYVGFGERLQTFPNARANAALIAACDPDTIRALLEERDRLATTLQAEVEALRAEVDGTIRELLAERDALRAARALREDAARYRWLRDREIPELLDLWHQNPDRIDAAIDQAMKEQA